jgi:peptidyl-prolyl cis-trans isomerase-like 4
VIKDVKTGESLCYAFIEFSEKKSAEDAYFKMENVLIDDRRIHVDFSQSVSKLHLEWIGKLFLLLTCHLSANIFSSSLLETRHLKAVKDTPRDLDKNRSSYTKKDVSLSIKDTHSYRHHRSPSDSRRHRSRSASPRHKSSYDRDVRRRRSPPSRSYERHRSRNYS